MQENLNKGIRILHDVDYVAVDIASGKIYNLFLNFLEKYRDNIVDCAAITGRNEDGLSRMLSNYREYQNPPNWDQFKKNELAEVGKEVCKALGKDEGSHVFCITDDIFYQKRPGYYYNEFYREVEAKVLQKSNFTEANVNLRSLAGHIDTRKEGFTLELCKGEDSRFNKGAQVEHYLSYVDDNHTTLYMDDVPENVLEVAKRNPKVISFFFDVKMGDDYNTQALDLAIKAANGDEEARKDLIKVTLEFKEFKTKFDSKEFKEINKISPNTSIADYVGCQFEDGEQDWFQVVRKLLTPEQTLRVNNNFVKFEFTREVNSFADEPLPMFDEKMGDDYNTQALDLAIKAANGNEEARKELIKATLEFKELSTGLSSQDLKSIMESSVNWGYNGENSTDLFQVIRSLLTPEQTLRVNNNFFKFESKRESSLSAGEPLPMSAGSPKFTPGPDVTKFRIVTDGLSEIKKSPGVKGAPLDPKSPEFIPATDVARFIFRTDGELLSIQRGSVEVADLGSMEWETFASSDSVKAGVPLFTPPAVMNPLEVETTLANSVHNVRGVFNNRNLIDSNLKPKRLFNNAIGPTVATPDPHLQGAAGARTEPSPRGDSDKSFQSAIHRTPAPYAQSESLKSEIHQSERSPNFSTTYENGIIKFKIRSGAGKATDASSPDKFHYNKEPDQLEIIPLNKDSIKYLSENYTIEKEQEKILKLLKEASTDTIKTFSSAKLESAKLDKDFFIAVMKVASKNHGITSIESEKDFKKALKEALKEVNTASEKKYDSQEAKELNKIAKYFSAKFQRLSEKDGYLTAREGRGNEVNKTPRRLFRVCTEENIQAFQNMNIEEMEQKGGVGEVAPLSSPRSARSVSVVPSPLIESSGDRGGFF